MQSCWLMERGVDMLFQPGTHDYVAYDVLWGAQNYPQLPVWYDPSGGHKQTPHGAAYKDNQNTEAFLWHHFFGGDPMLKPPMSSHKVDKETQLFLIQWSWSIGCLDFQGESRDILFPKLPS